MKLLLPNIKNSKKGFTLIELLVVIGILAILLAITLIAINPARQFGQANDTKRRSDILQVLNAIHQYAADNSGNMPANMPASGAPAANISEAGADICADLMPTYISALPQDPSSNAGAPITDCAALSGYDSGYTVQVDAANRVIIGATDSNSNPLTVTR